MVGSRASTSFFWGNGRYFGIHNPFGSKIGKARDPFINTATLMRLAISSNLDVQEAACISLAARIRNRAVDNLKQFINYPSLHLAAAAYETLSGKQMELSEKGRKLAMLELGLVPAKHFLMSSDIDVADAAYRALGIDIPVRDEKSRRLAQIEFRLREITDELLDLSAIRTTDTQEQSEVRAARYDRMSVGLKAEAQQLRAEQARLLDAQPA